MALYLGLDIGTTKTAALLLDTDDPKNPIVVAVEHDATLTAPPDHAEQDMAKILASVETAVAALPASGRGLVRGVGLTGQMHSVVLWNDRETSPVVTWQDHRASAAGLLASFRTATGRPLADGFAGVTLGVLALRGELDRWRHAATPPDFVGMCLCGADAVSIDPTFAASWGLFDTGANAWDARALAALAIPSAILPCLVGCGDVVGTTKGFAPLPDDVPVRVALGDNQASILGSSEDTDSDIFVTLGTGAQLSVVLTPEEEAAWTPPSEMETRPFPGERTLAVRAPLLGGGAWAWLAARVEDVFAAMGATPPPRDTIFARLDELALGVESGTGPRVRPDFLGERHEPDARGSVTGLTLDNSSLAHVAAGLADGIAHSLCLGLSPAWGKRRRRIVGSGNALRHSSALRRALGQVACLPVVVPLVREEAALGAARLAHSKDSIDIPP